MIKAKDLLKVMESDPGGWNPWQDAEKSNVPYGGKTDKDVATSTGSHDKKMKDIQVKYVKKHNGKLLRRI